MIFSKGGFVSVPVVLAGKRRHVPTIIHESDMTPGLANKLSIACRHQGMLQFPGDSWNIFPQARPCSPAPLSVRSCFSGDTVQGTGVSCGFTLRQTGAAGHRRKPWRCSCQCGHPRNSSGASERPSRLSTCAAKESLIPPWTILEGYVQYEYIKEELTGSVCPGRRCCIPGRGQRHLRAAGASASLTF